VAKLFSHPFSGNKATGKMSRSTTSEAGNATDSGGHAAAATDVSAR
jgi:hypothetical protein